MGNHMWGLQSPLSGLKSPLGESDAVVGPIFGPGDALTLEDGVSFLTLEDGTSKLLLEG